MYIANKITDVTLFFKIPATKSNLPLVCLSQLAVFSEFFVLMFLLCSTVNLFRGHRAVYLYLAQMKEHTHKQNAKGELFSLFMTMRQHLLFVESDYLKYL